MSKARKTELRSLRPGVEGWQLCVVGQDGQITARGVDRPLAKAGADVCVLPAETLTVCPLWLRTADDALLEGAIRLQLEKRNLLPEPTGGRLVAWRLVARDGGQVLALALVLSVERLKKLGVDEVEVGRFSLSPLAFDLPPNAMALWTELGRDVVVFTRDGELAYFQTLVAVDGRSRVLELACLAMLLESEGVIHPVQDVVLVNPLADDEAKLVEDLEAQIGVEAKIVPALAPKAGVETVDLLPPLEEGRRRVSSQRGRRKKMTVAVAVAYVALLFVLGGRLVWLKGEVASSRERQQFLAGKVADVRAAKELWQQVQGAVDPDEYPLEILSLCVEAIPGNGVRLTEFGVNSAGKIVLAGRADSVPLALAFKSSLTSKETLSHYDWNFPQPRNAKKGPGAVFKAAGTRKDYVTP